MRRAELGRELDGSDVGGVRDGPALLVARQHSREIEPEPVDVHVDNPKPQDLDEPLRDQRMIRAHGVAAPRKVEILRAVQGIEQIEELVDEPFETDPLDRSKYLDFTGCGNTVSSNHALVAQWLELTVLPHPVKSRYFER